MTTRQADSHTGASERGFDPLADETRRRVIRLLRGRSEPVPQEELCKQLADGGSNVESGMSAAEREKMRSLKIRLHHIHLPKLADSGLIEWDREERSVAAIDHAVFNVQPEEPVKAVEGDSIASAPAGDRDREILDIVEAENGAITRTALAHQLSLKEARADRTDRSVDEIQIQLHHSQLPRMEDEGLIEYGPDGEITVAESDRRSERGQFSNPLQ